MAWGIWSKPDLRVKALHVSRSYPGIPIYSRRREILHWWFQLRIWGCQFLSVPLSGAQVTAWHGDADAVDTWVLVRSIPLCLHRTTGCLGFEVTSSCPPLLPKQGHQELPWIMPRCLLNLFKNEDSTSSVDLIRKCLIAQSRNEALHWKGGREHPAFKMKESFKCHCSGSWSTDLNRCLVAHPNWFLEQWYGYLAGQEAFIVLTMSWIHWFNWSVMNSSPNFISLVPESIVSPHFIAEEPSKGLWILLATFVFLDAQHID